MSNLLLSQQVLGKSVQSSREIKKNLKKINKYQKHRKRGKLNISFLKSNILDERQRIQKNTK